MTDPLPSVGELARSRAALYRWFAQAFFAPPDEATVKSLREGAMADLLKSLESIPAAGAGVAAMQWTLSDGDVREVAAALGAAYVRLFDGVGGPESVPPYRSVYENEEGLLCGQATAEMDRALRQHRMRLAESVHEPSDHLAIQLEAMSQLALCVAEEAAAQQRPLPPLLAEQREFLDAHLRSWVGRFSERLAAIDASGYYAGLASVLEAFLEQDRDYLTADA